MRILFDYKYDKYLFRCFRFVLVSINTETIKSLSVYTKVNYGVVRELQPGTMQMKAFGLNKYENCGKVLKFELYRVNILTITTVKLHVNCS